MEVSSFSAIFLLLSIFFDQIKKKTKKAGNIESEDTDVSTCTSTGSTFFKYWSFSTMYPILLKAFGGVLTALVHKHAGSVAKGFALICGLVLSGIIQTIIDNESLSVDQIIGIFLMNLSSWLHFSTPKLV
eukprot:CAMPEP_0197830820 /NCGR_PEP_ID=MMETSP1437-20131217/7435_1 /TAXON_ID=49252 ORGANISM="Eucampia antarctica, Strain CCMP1452" /NCGR_SAMPLE_ID=MMETSP1437 /ASSEMBLY_ACC=CAM_ASM_001096 /LENGTH=129 /DNA_ID=CAMNT_0043433457 /DNA_START=736 /DNA_END=1125 /DNA_ORIENTATION=+